VNAGPRIAALIPAHDEATSVGATVRTVATFVNEVFVVDDGSGDGTAAAALEAGASVLRIPRRIGKGGALEGALRRVPKADIWLFADADLGATANGLQVLVECVLAGIADLAIASFPPQSGGGLGTVKTFASRSISLLGHLHVTEPLSGQRAITSACLAAVRPLATGFGVETAMTIDAARAGFNVTEIPVRALRHRQTHRSLRGFRHRGRQGVDIARAVARRLAPRRRRPGAA
jgi:glycosyltransferase involved in cell wall biosynthesis